MIIEYTVMNILEQEGTEVRYQVKQWEDDIGKGDIPVRSLFTGLEREYGKCISLTTERTRGVIGWTFAKQKDTTQVQTRVRVLQECPHCGGTGKKPITLG